MIEKHFGTIYLTPHTPRNAPKIPLNTSRIQLNTVGYPLDGGSRVKYIIPIYFIFVRRLSGRSVFGGER